MPLASDSDDSASASFAAVPSAAALASSSALALASTSALLCAHHRQLNAPLHQTILPRSSACLSTMGRPLNFLPLCDLEQLHNRFGRLSAYTQAVVLCPLRIYLTKERCLFDRICRLFDHFAIALFARISTLRDRKHSLTHTLQTNTCCQKWFVSFGAHAAIMGYNPCHMHEPTPSGFESPQAITKPNYRAHSWIFTYAA